MKIVQLIPSLNARDAIGNDVLAIDDALREAGYQSVIMARKAARSLASRVADVEFGRIAPDDLAILHVAAGDALIRQVASLSCRRGLLYHNITPARFILPYDPTVAAILLFGRLQVRRYAPRMDFAWGDSRYNCSELIRSGVDESRVSVLPVLAETCAPEPPDPALLERLRSQAGTKLLFIGRLTPNKRQEDVIKVYWHVLQRDREARLFLVGSWQGMEKYYAKLKGFCADLGISDDQVVFTGSVSEAEKQAYLRGSDLFVCMSEHEGFCVPIVEAMRSGLPVIAYAAAAVPETLGDNGLLFYEKDYALIAEMARVASTDAAFRDGALLLQQERLRMMEAEPAQATLLGLVEQELARGRRHG